MLSYIVDLSLEIIKIKKWRKKSLIQRDELNNMLAFKNIPLLLSCWFWKIWHRFVINPYKEETI